MLLHRYFTWPLGLALLAATAASDALQVSIQGAQMGTLGPGDQCVLIAGEYPGVRVEPSEAGKRAKICYDTIRQNLIVIGTSTFVSTRTGGTQVEVSFSHVFPPGPNRKVIAHTRMKGFFATATGVGVPAGANISVLGAFSQHNNDDIIGEGISHQVADDIDSGLFEGVARERYLVAGIRELKGRLSFRLMARGDKLVLTDGIQVDVQAVTRIQEKFEEAEEGFESEFGDEDLTTPIPLSEPDEDRRPGARKR